MSPTPAYVMSSKSQTQTHYDVRMSFSYEKLTLRGRHRDTWALT